MQDTRFGIEIEFTGITREKAAMTVAELLGSTAFHEGGFYDSWMVKQQDGRIWKIMRDGSITCQKTENGRRVYADGLHSVELVSPILTYREDMDTLQSIARALRKAGGFANGSCGIHIHLDGAGHDARSIRNFINIIASRNDLFYKALDIESERAKFCRKMDERLVSEINRRKPSTLAEIEEIWYRGYYGEARDRHYHSSRYHFLNLHSFFHGHGTVELRGFNSTLHAGEIRSYVVLALALDNQARTQRSASARRPQTENEKFAMRTYLNRIGLIGDEFKACREHLTKHLNGSAAWRFRTAV